MTATRICGRDPEHTETESAAASGKITLEPSCETAGETTYTSKPFENDAFVVQTKTVANIPALGHEWGDPVYEWAADRLSVTATRVCVRDESHTETETVNATPEITIAPKCEAMGQTTYTSDAFANEAFTVQSVTRTDIPALRHSWGPAEYTWAEDLETVTAAHTCTRDESHVQTETVRVTRTVSLAPTEDETGTFTLTSGAFTNSAFTQQERTEIIPAIQDMHVLTLPADLKTIESEAFSGLPGIDAVRMPARVNSIADDAFDQGILLIVHAGSYAETWAAEHDGIWAIPEP